MGLLAALGAVVAALALFGGGSGDVGPPAPDATSAVAASPSPSTSAWAPAVPQELDALDRVGDGLVTEAPVVVVADVTDRLDRDVAAWLAARLQAVVVAARPAVAGEPSPSPAAGVLPEGLGTGLVVAVGDVAVPGDVTVRRVVRSGRSVAAGVDRRTGPLDVRRLTRVVGRAEPPYPVDLSEVATLLDGAAPADPTGTVLLARSDAVPSEIVATALALGHRVTVTDADDPRADPSLGDALGEAGEDTRVALLGDGWAEVEPEAWEWKLRVAAAGEELPGGGQLVYPGRIVVALYGHPVASSLGALGEQPLEETIVRAAEQAAAYEEHVDVPVTPALEIIATVAARVAGAHGDYSTRTDVDVLRPYVDAAREAGQLVVLDLQPGRTDFLTQARQYEELLREPHVGLALDPEWRLAPHEVHLNQIGSVTGQEVNTVVEWLADLVRAEALPQKIVMVHQFRLSMIRDREAIDLSRDELAMVLHMDGQGPQGTKLDSYEVILRGASDDWHIGWKNFFDEDLPTRTPEGTASLEPRPEFVSYQ